MLKILVITKRQYTNYVLLDNRFGRLWELPLELALKKHKVYGLCLSYKNKEEGKICDGPVEWQSINAGPLKIPGLLRFIKRASWMAKRADVIWASPSKTDSAFVVVSFQNHFPSPRMLCPPAGV